MPDPQLILAELDKIDASAATLTTLYEADLAPVPVEVTDIENASASLRASLVPPLGDEIVVGPGEEVIIDRPILLTKLHINGGTCRLRDGARITWKNVPVFGPIGEYPGILVESGLLVREGAVGVAPSFSDLGRTVVFDVEDPAGVCPAFRSTMHGVVQLQDVEFVDTGRTLVGPFTQTNVIGHYAMWHFHHEHSDQPTFIKNCTYRTTRPDVKWAVAVHQKSFAAVENNVITGTKGAGVVTEDGNEHRCVFRGNLISGCVGDGSLVTDGSQTNFGNDGAGGWKHSSFDDVEDNVVENCRTGVMVFPEPTRNLGWGPGIARLPKLPGNHVTNPGEYDTVRVEVTTAFDLTFHKPIKRNTVRNCHVGAEFWKLAQSDPPVLLADGGSSEGCDLGMRTAFIHGAHVRNYRFGTPGSPCVEGFRMHSDFRDSAPAAYNHLMKLEDCEFNVTEKAVIGSFAKGLDYSRVTFNSQEDAVVLHQFPHRFRRFYELIDVTFNSPTWLRVHLTDWGPISGNPDTHVFFGPTYTRVKLADNSDDFEVYFPEQAPDFVPPAATATFLGVPSSYFDEGGASHAVPPGLDNSALQALLGVSTFGYKSPEWSALEDHPNVVGAKICRTVRQMVKPKVVNPGIQQRTRLSTDLIRFSLEFDHQVKPLWVYRQTAFGWEWWKAPDLAYQVKPVWEVPLPRSTFGFLYRTEGGEYVWLGWQMMA